jgi:hypothetical protein
VAVRLSEQVCPCAQLYSEDWHNSGLLERHRCTSAGTLLVVHLTIASHGQGHRQRESPMMLNTPLKGQSNSLHPMRWLAYFAALNVALVTVVLLTLWASGSFAGAGLSTNGWVALFLGTLVTAALGIALLMGLVFYSDRDDVDDRAYHATDRKQ